MSVQPLCKPGEPRKCSAWAPPHSMTRAVPTATLSAGARVIDSSPPHRPPSPPISQQRKKEKEKSPPPRPPLALAGAAQGQVEHGTHLHDPMGRPHANEGGGGWLGVGRRSPAGRPAPSEPAPRREVSDDAGGAGRTAPQPGQVGGRGARGGRGFELGSRRRRL